MVVWTGFRVGRKKWKLKNNPEMETFSEILIYGRVLRGEVVNKQVGEKRGSARS